MMMKMAKMILMSKKMLIQLIDNHAVDKYVSNLDSVFKFCKWKPEFFSELVNSVNMADRKWLWQG